MTQQAKERCPKCDSELVSFGANSDRGEHDIGGESCLRRQLTNARLANAELAMTVIEEIAKFAAAELLAEACKRQIVNIEEWMLSGIPAGPAESRSIYEQMEAAMDAWESAKGKP